MGRRKRRSFTPEYKAEVVALLKKTGKSAGQIAKELDLTETVVREWAQQTEIDERRRPGGPLTSEERAELTRLRRELKTVTMERDFRRPS
jgi:transposase